MLEMLEDTISGGLTLSAGDSPVKISLRPVGVPVSPAAARVFGLNTLELLANFDPTTCSLRTYPSLKAVALKSSWLIWPRSGMMRSGTVFRLSPLVPLIAVIGSSSWPTPTVADVFTANLKSSQQKPTTISDWGTRGRVWPTPTLSDGTGGPGTSPKREGGLNLRTAVKLFPTPTARDYKDAGPNTNYQKAADKSRLAGVAGGELNPTWVEWLMGFPLGWTDLPRWVTRSSRKSQNGLGGK